MPKEYGHFEARRNADSFHDKQQVEANIKKTENQGQVALLRIQEIKKARDEIMNECGDNDQDKQWGSLDRNSGLSKAYESLYGRLGVFCKGGDDYYCAPDSKTLRDVLHDIDTAISQLQDIVDGVIVATSDLVNSVVEKCSHEQSLTKSIKTINEQKAFEEIREGFSYLDDDIGEAEEFVLAIMQKSKELAINPDIYLSTVLNELTNRIAFEALQNGQTHVLETALEKIVTLEQVFDIKSTDKKVLKLRSTLQDIEFEE